MQITPVPALKDNYIWCIHNERYCVCVDPGESAPVKQFLKHKQLELSGIILTHHHWDHSGGIEALTKLHPVPVFGSHASQVESVSHKVKTNDIIDLPRLDAQLNVLEVPGHTLDHTAFYNDEMLFSGDTLFSAGCGRVFEGTLPQMHQSLTELANLNPELKLYCGHEYTVNNLEFALTLEPENPILIERLSQAKTLRDSGLSTLPVKLGLERQTNPFLRCHDSDFKAIIAKSYSLTNPSDDAVFSHIRQLKDAY